MDLVLVREAGGKVMISLKHPWENWMKFPGEQEGKVSGRLFSGPLCLCTGKGVPQGAQSSPYRNARGFSCSFPGKDFLFIITFHSIHGLLKGVCEPQGY